MSAIVSSTTPYQEKVTVRDVGPAIMDSLNKLVEKLNENEYVKKGLDLAEQKTGLGKTKLVGGRFVKFFRGYKDSMQTK